MAKKKKVFQRRSQVSENVCMQVPLMPKMYCRVHLLLLHCTNFKLGYSTVSIIHYSHTIPYTMYLSHRHDTKKILSLTCRWWQKSGGDPTYQQQRTPRNGAKKARYSRIFSAFAFALPMFLFRLRLLEPRLPSLSFDLLSDIHLSSSIKQLYSYQIIPLLSLITFLHSLRKPFLSRGI